MIIQNGTIEAKGKTEWSIDATTGFPVAPVDTQTEQTIEPSWGNPIPCQWRAVTQDNLGRTQAGNFVIASYTVLIEQSATPFTAEQVRLKDMAGTVLGDRLSVISTEELDAVCQTRIMLK